VPINYVGLGRLGGGSWGLWGSGIRAAWFGYRGSRHETNTNEQGDHVISQPYFENFYQRNVTITEGKSAYLHCRVRNLGNKTVAWVRVRDLHLLTLDIVTYTSDSRFRSIHDDDTDDWTLKISFTKLRDSGIYLCQVNAEPWITQHFKLNVVGKCIMPWCVGLSPTKNLPVQALETLSGTHLCNYFKRVPSFAQWALLHSKIHQNELFWCFIAALFFFALAPSCRTQRQRSTIRDWTTSLLYVLYYY
ncbi:hypothetical protein J6590_102574, partial [Homalodisca vitripennis]